DRQVRRLRALEDATGIDADLMVDIGKIGSVAHQPAGFGKVTCRIRRGDRMARCQVDQLDTPAEEEGIRADEKSIWPLAHESGKGYINLTAGAGLEGLDSQSDSASSRFDVSYCNYGSPRSTSTATRVAVGTISRRSSSRFATNSPVRKLTPVRLPPGRDRLATKPRLTGSSLMLKTIGIVEVAPLSAKTAAGPPTAVMTVTCRRTRSAANSGSRSIRFSAQRYTIVTFSPST